MTLLTEKANEQAKADREAKQVEPEVTEPVAETADEPVTEQAEPEKAKRSRKREKVAVA